MGFLCFQERPGRPLLRREMRSLRPPNPLFLEKTSCLARILGESGDSGHNPCSSKKAKRREIEADSRTILELDTGIITDSRSGPIMGVFFL